MSNFHDILFPIDIALRSSGGPERKTDVVSFASGREQRNSRWQSSRRRYDAGYGIKNISELQKIIVFFEERRGKLYSFRWRDRLDYKSCSAAFEPSSYDQNIGVGNGTQKDFQLIKLYGEVFAPYKREIFTPVKNSVLIDINGNRQIEGKDFTINYTTGLISFIIPPTLDALITAGFLFDVPVRFDTDYLEVNFSGFESGVIPKIPIVEVAV